MTTNKEKIAEVVEEKMQILDVKLEGLFNDAVRQCLRCVRKEQTEEEMHQELKSLNRAGLELITTTLTKLLEERDERLVAGIENELDIQKKVYEKSKEAVAVGRARVAGMVAEKYTRIGKIEAIQEILALIKNTN